MKAINKSTLISVVVMSGLFVVPVAQATNGYFMHGYSTKEKGLAGAGVAYSQDSLAAATNPAGMAFVGERMDAAVTLFSPSDRSFTLTGTPVGYTGPGAPATFVNAAPGTKYTSENDLFFVPQFGYSMALDSESVFGVSVYGNGGMNTKYAASATPGGAGVFGAGDAGINLEQMFFNISYAKKIDPKQAYGVSFIMVGQRFSAQGLEPFGALGFSLDPNNLSGNRHSYSYGAGVKLGYQGEVADNFSVGVSYQSKIAMTEFDEYKGLFAEAGGFDVPSTYTLGFSYDLGASGKVVFDVQKINYSEVASVANPVQNLFGCTAPGDVNCLGGANGGGFGWEDMTVMKLGYEIDAGGNVYRFGYSKGDMPITGGANPMTSQTFFNILAPAVIEQHITFGMTAPIGQDQEFNLAVMIAPNTSVKGANPFDGGSTDIEIEMEQKEIQVGWAWKY